jgi:hypothetical protein
LEFRHEPRILAIHYRAVRDRIRAEEPQIEEQTLANAVEEFTDLHEIETGLRRDSLGSQ